MMRTLLPLLSGAVIFATPSLAQTAAPAVPPPTVAQPGTGGVLTEAQRAGYAGVFAAIRASSWIDALAGLEALGDGPLHNVARAELYLAKGSPTATLEQLQDLLTRAPELPEAEQLGRLAQ